MSYRAASPQSRSSSARAKKRHRQKSNQQKRALDHDALVILHEHPTFANAFRAWLAHTRDFLSPQEHRSAFKFTRALRSLSSKGTAQPDYPETQRLSVDTLVQWVDDLAWSLNVELTLKDDAGKLKTPTSRVGPNFRSFVHFLAREGVFGQPDVNYLLDSCRCLEEDLDRTARVNRIMEQYTLHIQETYFDVGHVVDQSHWGEYEVEKVSSRRVFELRKYDVAEDVEANETPPDCFSTRFPAPLMHLLKVGDILTLQICNLEQKGIWVPYMYSGFTPTRDDGGETPTETREESRTPTDSPKNTKDASNAGDDVVTVLQGKLSRVELSSAEQQQQQRRGRRGSESEIEMEVDPLSGDNFDEESFTEEYFQSWEGDIDSDEDVGELLNDDDGHQLSSFRRTLRERHL